LKLYNIALSLLQLTLTKSQIKYDTKMNVTSYFSIHGVY